MTLLIYLGFLISCTVILCKYFSLLEKDFTRSLKILDASIQTLMSVKSLEVPDAQYTHLFLLASALCDKLHAINIGSKYNMEFRAKLLETISRNRLEFELKRSLEKSN